MIALTLLLAIDAFDLPNHAGRRSDRRALTVEDCECPKNSMGYPFCKNAANIHKIGDCDEVNNKGCDGTSCDEQGVIASGQSRTNLYGCDDTCPPTPTTPTPAFSGADPITSIDGMDTRFYCKKGVLTHMYEDDVVDSIQYVVSGLEADESAGVAHHHGDWITTFNVTFHGAPNAPLVVKAVRDPAKLSSTNGPRSLLYPGEAPATMQVSVGGKPLLAGSHAVISSIPKLRVSVKSGTTRIGCAFVEKVDITLPGLALRVATAEAAKFESEEMQLRGLHLDIEYKKFDRAAARGPLAEMWGLRTMTNATRAMLVPPRSVA